MCGIVGYVGPRDAYPIIINGLRRLEYRGYDSAGIGFITEKGINIYKKKGRVKDLDGLFTGEKLLSHIAIGHTRWATHGDPNDQNAHPQKSASGKLAMVHNGIIENYSQLKSELLKKGYSFSSDTDTEVLLNYIEDISVSNRVDTEEALRIALQKISGNYVVSILDTDRPDTILAARKGNPLPLNKRPDDNNLR